MRSPRSYAQKAPSPALVKTFPATRHDFDQSRSAICIGTSHSSPRHHHIAITTMKYLSIAAAVALVSTVSADVPAIEIKVRLDIHAELGVH